MVFTLDLGSRAASYQAKGLLDVLQNPEISFAVPCAKDASILR